MSVSCTQNPPLCLFFANLAAEHSYSHVFQASLSRIAANNCFKTIILAVDFLDFVMSNPTKTSPTAIQHLLKLGSGAVPGALGGDLGTISVVDWPKAQKWQ